MRTTPLLTALTHLAIGLVATGVLLAVIFAAGILVYDGARTHVVTTMSLIGANTGHPVTTRIILPTTRVALLLFPIAGLFTGLSYALFGRRKS